ncbi:MAG: SDR family oxidoreductase [Actinobacteria bacterium]|nr:SDR family oxidoreductase [Actinomycetota bacterium]
MDLDGKTALVTGAAKRVGRVIALTLAKAGANVVINYNSSADDAEATASEAEALGVGAMTFAADVGDYDAVGLMVEAAKAKFGGIDVLVNNASSFHADPFPTSDLTVWNQAISTLVNGPFYCTNLVAPSMLERGGGVVVSGDLSAFEAWPGYMAHAVGKSAILAMTRQFALELAPTIRANAIVPGPALRPHDYDDGRYQRTADKTLLGRWGTPDEMAHGVKYLVEADYVTGEYIIIDGGQQYGHRKAEAG